VKIAQLSADEFEATGMPLKNLDCKSGLKKFFAKVSSDPLSQAFSDKFTIHAGLVGQAIGEERITQTYQALLEQQSKPMAIYIHVPFCQGRCLYCGFMGKDSTEQYRHQYVEALLKEIEYTGAKAVSKGPVRTIYFGGGTPSCLDPGDLKSVLEALDKWFDLANDCEMTLEGRISDFDNNRALEFLQTGFNRFSIGIQTFDTAVRQSLGRKNDGSSAQKLLSRLVEYQKAAVIIDLIFGLPGQSLEIFLNDIKSAESLGVDGLDTYQLNVFNGGLLAKAIKLGTLQAPAPLSSQGKYYASASDYLCSKRWRVLSLSHYARSTRERNFYNPWAKRRRQCLAFGAGAGGFLNGHAFYRRPNVKRYLERASLADFAPDFMTFPTSTDEITSFIVGQMEEGHLNIQQLFSYRGIETSVLKKLFDNWQEAKLVTVDKEWLTMSLPGRFWGVNLTQAVVEAATNKNILE
jgi:oxygen-independent coproporphyrinogen-3 oxidase